MKQPPKPAVAPGDWFTVRQAAVHIQEGPRTIYKAIKADGLKATPVNDRGDLRIHRTWLMDWMESRATVGPRAVRRVS
jgi:excisionase family DNA binding protein